MEASLESKELKGKILIIPRIDKTLTKEGYAADAKVTGEAIEKMVKKVDIVNDLETEDSNKPLSAMQGVALKELIDALDTRIGALEEQSSV